ncbi:MAG: penicillin-binding transpeptidase domain-containing protein [Lachnospiraceae bacterium]|nr:penicillin-binding transpeptidase domain-containing protein [Lachnospiraceae bacterium]
MAKKIRRKKGRKKFRIRRSSILIAFFLILSGILLYRLFKLQIIDGEDYANNFSLRTTKERAINSVRGNIFDRDGNVLASNQLSYSLTLEDNGSYASTREKNLSLNYEALRINQILESNGDKIDFDFHIVIDANGNYTFDIQEGITLQRFRADVFGRALIDDLEEDEVAATPDEIMEYLSGNERFCLVNADNPYKAEELSSHNLPETFTKEETLKIVIVRYALSTNSFQKYKAVTIATNISDNAVASLMEVQSQLQGIEIAEDSIRVYTDAEYFAPILGYTGKVSAEELAELKDNNPTMDYGSTSIVGKTGIEQYMETTLQGTNGSETVYVDNLGKVLEIDENSRVEPTAGNDVYLTIDKDLQEATYKILEQRIAGVLITNIINAKEFDKTTVTSSDLIRIPIYDVYFALINNSVLNIDHFFSTDASELETSIGQRFTAKQTQIFEAIKQELTGTNPAAYNELSREMQEYMSYIVNDLLMSTTGILDENAIDKNDATYLAWTRDESISLQEYLTYAASQNWIDISSISTSDTYLDSAQVYDTLATYIADYLSTDTAFSKLLYKYMIKDDTISGREICRVLYDQGILDKNDTSYEDLAGGTLSAFDFMIEKLTKLEITPAQLALDPCSGSAVVTDPNTGEIRACVTYPGYDNNRLANTMDVAYYRQLSADLSQSFYNKATQQRTAPGSTFKLVTAIAGLSEGSINTETVFNCNGTFSLTETPLRCWYTEGHGDLTVVTGIQNSCNVFFCNVAYTLGTSEDGTFSDNLALQKLQNYAKLVNLDQNSGIEISEATPQVSDQYGIQSSIGQGTHNYTTSQLARYVTTLANSGTSYNISLLDKTTDSAGNLLEDYNPQVLSTINIDSGIWDVVHQGMRAVIANNTVFSDMTVEMSGKTGTAQESRLRPNHALFIGYAPSTNPQIALAVRISNGYASTNTAYVAKDIVNYYLNLTDEATIITGNASVDGSTTVQTD